jgi:hypothetical protein
MDDHDVCRLALSGKEVTEKIETIRETLRCTDVQSEEMPGVLAFDEYAGDFRSTCTQRLAGSCLAYERNSPAFRRWRAEAL